MTPQTTELLHDTYLTTTDQTPLYVIVIEDEGVYCESPVDQGLTEDENQESMLRVFTNAPDAIRYMEIIETWYPESNFHVLRLTLPALWKTVNYLDERALMLHGCPLRIDLSYTPVNEFSATIDTIYSKYEHRH